MAKQYGTLQILDELLTADNDNVFTYGEDTLYDHIRDILVAHNAMTEQIVATFVEPTTKAVSRYGSDAVTGEMVDVDEWGAADVQKTSVAGYDIGWPLRSYQYALGWTRKYFETHTVADLAQNLVAAQAADVRGLKKRTLDALFRATNYSFIDRLVDNQTLPVKALQNADGAGIPVNEFGSSFNAATHTHLVGRAGGSVAASDIVALIDNVAEHGVDGGEIVLYINQAQEATIRAFTSNFAALQAPLLTPGPGSTDDVVDGGARENMYAIDDKYIGVWDGFVRVFVKPWMPANYYLALLVRGNRRGKVLRLRTRGIAGYGSFRMVADHDHFPLRAQHMEREFGVGVWNRLAAAILWGGGTSYQQPTISL